MPTDSDLDSNLKDSHRCQSGGREVEESGGGGNRLACKHGGAKGVQTGLFLGRNCGGGAFPRPTRLFYTIEQARGMRWGLKRIAGTLETARRHLELIGGAPKPPRGNLSAPRARREPRQRPGLNARAPGPARPTRRCATSPPKHPP